MTTLADFEANTLTGQPQSLSEYAGKVVLVVNTASKCGFTPQYKDLQALYDQYKDQGFTILGFPCNQFGAQEQGSADEISQFCELNYGVTFPMFEKIDVNGSNEHPLYTWMKSEQRGMLMTKKVKWNFTKFLINKEGKVIQRYAPTTTPKEIERDIVKLLK